MAAPDIVDLLGFDDPLILFSVNGRFESKPRISGASIDVKTSGTAVMLFKAGPDWTFADTGGQQQETRKSGVMAGQPDSMTMSWSVSTAVSDAFKMSVSVIVSMDGETTSRVKTNEFAVTYASMFANLMHRVGRMFRA